MLLKDQPDGLNIPPKLWNDYKTTTLLACLPLVKYLLRNLSGPEIAQIYEKVIAFPSNVNFHDHIQDEKRFTKELHGLLGDVNIIGKFVTAIEKTQYKREFYPASSRNYTILIPLWSAVERIKNS